MAFFKNMNMLGVLSRATGVAAIVLASGWHALADTQAKPSQQTIVGWVERVALTPGDVVLAAKVDTGAVSCSLHAPNMQEYEVDGKKWVRFRIKDAEGKERTIERPLAGMKRIKRHFGGFQMRPVIKLGVCLGGYFKEVRVNLVDRTGFEYQMLIGRDFMDGALLVNPSAKHTMEPTCGEKSK